MSEISLMKPKEKLKIKNIHQRLTKSSKSSKSILLLLLILISLSNEIKLLVTPRVPAIDNFPPFLMNAAVAADGVRGL